MDMRDVVCERMNGFWMKIEIERECVCGGEYIRDGNAYERKFWACDLHLGWSLGSRD